MFSTLLVVCIVSFWSNCSDKTFDTFSKHVDPNYEVSKSLFQSRKTQTKMCNIFLLELFFFLMLLTIFFLFKINLTLKSVFYLPIYFFC